MLAYELLRWLGYFRIRHPRMSIYTKVLPLCAGVFFTLAYGAMPRAIAITGGSGLFAGILQMFANLPGFFIAALAAVATFSKTGMDEPMPNPCPTIDMMVRGRRVDVQLTRRVFLSFLFSYLTVISLFICLVCVLGNALSDNIEFFLTEMQKSTIGDYAASAVRLLTLLVLFTSISSIFIATLHGIYFLTERMHQPNE